MKRLWFCVLLAAMLSACGIEEMVRRNDDRLMQPGVLDLPLSRYYDIYNIPFLGQYRITHDWPVISNCEYRKQPTLNRPDRYKGEIYAVRDIYEEGGKTWQRFEGIKPYDFDQYVRSVMSKSESYHDINGVLQTFPSKEIGFQPICFQSWQVASIYFRARLHKRDLATWQAMQTAKNPQGKWSKRVVGSNTWTVQETAEQDFRPRPLNGVGGPYQYWLLPIGSTGYTMAFELGSSQETLKYPQAFDRFKAKFRHLIESVKIEALP